MDTTNIIATCFYKDQAGNDIQIGGRYIVAPSITNVDYFEFDASEIFNTITKYTLNDYPDNLKWGENRSDFYYKRWDFNANWKVFVNFQREFLDATTGLIELDPTTRDSNIFAVHEGCPDNSFIYDVIQNNGLTGNGSTFDYFRMKYIPSFASFYRWFTNYPIEIVGNSRVSFVTIHETEQFMLMWYNPRNQPYCTNKINISTFDNQNNSLNQHADVIPIVENTDCVQTMACGFRDIQNSLTANASEGTNFENVARYVVNLSIGASTGNPCSYTRGGTIWDFKVDRSCIKNVGYLRFIFKNMLGGYDMVTSRGKFSKKQKDKFEDFEQTLGLNNWNNAMTFGNSNWANENVERYSVTTQPLKPKYAKHFAEMFSSTQVYLRTEFKAGSRIVYSEVSIEQSEKPYHFIPIVITGATRNVINSDDNTQVLKFTFEVAKNQRNPRY